MFYPFLGTSLVANIFIGFFLLRCINCLYVLKINPLSVALFPYIFFHSEGCLFLFFMVLFVVQNFKFN